MLASSFIVVYRQSIVCQCPQPLSHLITDKPSDIRQQRTRMFWRLEKQADGFFHARPVSVHSSSLVGGLYLMPVPVDSRTGCLSATAAR